MSEDNNTSPQTHVPVRLTFKELEWKAYEAGLRARMFGLDYFIMPSTMIDNYRINLVNYNDYAPTIEAAKKIAQDDFERVVRKVITEDPPAPETKMTAEEAWSLFDSRRFLHGHRETMRDSFIIAFKALSCTPLPETREVGND